MAWGPIYLIESIIACVSRLPSRSNLSCATFWPGGKYYTAVEKIAQAGSRPLRVLQKPLGSRSPFPQRTFPVQRRHQGNVRSAPKAEATAAAAASITTSEESKPGFLGIAPLTWQKILPLGFMFFCILFNYTILRDTKVTHQSSLLLGLTINFKISAWSHSTLSPNKAKRTLPCRPMLMRLQQLTGCYFVPSVLWLIEVGLQDVLVVTAPGSGAEVIPFLKTWVNLPMAIGFTVLYAKVCSSQSLTPKKKRVLKPRAFEATLCWQILCIGIWEGVVL